MRIASLVYNDFTRDSRVEKQANSLTNAGYDVTVFALWKKGLKSFESINKYSIKRVKSPFGFNISSIAKIIEILNFTIIVSWKIRTMDLVHCHDYHPLPAIILSKLIFRTNAKVIYDAHEFESHKLGLGKISKSLILSLEKISTNFVAGFITVSGSILNMYENLFRQIPKILILNCPPSEDLTDSNKFHSVLSLPANSLNCLYQGGFIPYRGIEELISGFSEEKVKDVNLILMGHGGTTEPGKNLEKHIIELSLSEKNIYYLRSVPVNELLSYTSSATFGVCLTIDNCLNHRYSLPNKFFEYAMAGLPVLINDLPEMRKLVEKYECGVICESITPDGIRRGLKELLQKDLKRLSRNARKMAEDHSWEVQEKKLLSLYELVMEVKS
jgi:glycosyltransferase involved in cell wall biosynthesis